MIVTSSFLHKIQIMININTISLKYVLATLAIVVICSCNTKYTTYDGPELIQFADTMNILPVIDSNQIHEIHIASSKTTNSDRNFAVRVVNNKTNAIEGYHFDIENYTATIKAGEHTAPIKIRCYPDKIEELDSIGITLTLVDRNDEFNLKGINSHIILKRICNFELNNFLGYCVVTSQFLDKYTREKRRLCEVFKDENVENGIVVKDYLQDGYNIKLSFDTRDPLKPYLKMADNQIIAKASGFFGHIYNDDKLRIYQPEDYPSEFNSCGEYAIQYGVFYIEKEGTVGIFRTILFWISDAEAEYMKSQGY